jgi:hypothetical protein
MKQLWSATMPAPERWEVFYGPVQVGELWWIVQLTHPTSTLARIVDGLNKVHGPQPARTWQAISAGPTIDTQFELLHNGVSAGELSWTQPVRNPRQWVDRVLDGLNLVSPNRNIPAPAPLRPLRPVQVGQL